MPDTRRPWTARRSRRVAKGHPPPPLMPVQISRWCWVVLFLPTMATATTPVVLVDLDLKTQRVRLQGLADGLISYFGSDRQLHVEPSDRFVQLRQGSRNPTKPLDAAFKNHPEPHVVQLIDGQRLVGQWIGGDASDDKLIWRHPVLGRVALSLEQILTVGPSDSIHDRVAGSATDDTVELVNGDVLLGFVVGVGDDGLVFQPQGHTQTVALPMGRVRAMDLAAPTDHRDSNRPMIWLGDGSRFATGWIEVASDQVSVKPVLTPGTPIKTVPMQQIIRIDLASPRGYLVDLVDLPMRVTGGGAVFGLSFEPRVVGDSVWMHAPVQIQYDLPTQARRFGATAVVANESAPAEAGDWSDLEVILQTDHQVVFRDRLNANRPTVQINTPLSGRVLTIELDTAGNGPVMDRLLLRDPVVLVQQ